MEAIDPERLRSEWAADNDVLDSLARNGNVNSVTRGVDIQFVGEFENLKILQKDASSLGFESGEPEKFGDGWDLNLRREMTTEPLAIHDLTKECLLIGAKYRVRLDGWGCLACNEAGPISKENPA